MTRMKSRLGTARRLPADAETSGSRSLRVMRARLGMQSGSPSRLSAAASRPVSRAAAVVFVVIWIACAVGVVSLLWW
jgi:hypothetical protein